MQTEIECDEPLDLQMIELGYRNSTYVRPGAVDEGIVVEEFTAEQKSYGEKAVELLFRRTSSRTRRAAAAVHRFPPGL